MPSAPPPARALPPTPPIDHSYPVQAVSSRPRNPASGSAVQAHPLPVGSAQQNNVHSHPYSPHPYASNITPKPHPSRGPNDTAYPATSYRQSLRQLYHSPRPNHRQCQSPSPPSSASILSSSVGLGIRCPQQRQTIIPIDHSPVPLPNSVLGGSEIPGCVLRARGELFRCISSSTSRDRSNSANSHSSLGGPRPMTTSTPNLHSSDAVSPSLHTASNHLQSTDSVSQTPNSFSSQAGRSQRPFSQRALTAALELTKAAVQLDATNEDPHGAVVAYARSVQLLGEVMERVMRGEDASSSGHAGATDGEESRRGGRQRSVIAKEEEVCRLKPLRCARSRAMTDIQERRP